MTGVEFKQLRRLAGLTQEKAAQVLGVTHRTIIRWERSETRIKHLYEDAIRRRFVTRMFGVSTRMDGEG